MIRWVLKEYLKQHAVTAYTLAKEAGLSANTVYPIARDEADRIDKATLNRILATLEKLTGKPVALTDLLEYTPEARGKRSQNKPLETSDKAERPQPWQNLAGSWQHPNSPGDMSISHDRYDAEALADELQQLTGKG